jgi:hypothetical protein
MIKYDKLNNNALRLYLLTQWEGGLKIDVFLVIILQSVVSALY